MSQTNVERWCEALLLPGETEISSSGVRELAEYFGLSPDEAQQLCDSSLADSRQEWETASRETKEAILDFYDRTRSYIFEHVWWHATDTRSNAINVEIIDYACRCGARAYLDFGSGVGANAILAARSGLSVTLADVSKTMLDFARWRLERRGLKANFIYLREQPLPRESFDFITALDVMEHLPRPAEEISRMSAALRTGGRLIFNARPGFDAERPMHLLATMYPVRRGLRGSGLRAENDEDAAHLRALDYYVFRKSSDGALINLGWRMYDSLRFGPLAEAVFQRLATAQKNKSQHEQATTQP
ncbi:MAG TPA: class I SAM-dependent methyltransferase [Blastocatellia bacterium]|nr:class I SAM-dependent methyltransferase [Blastocatellia bacterium]